MPTFSFIIPVYNVKDYLEKCVDSLLAQTCQDFEVLLIDDGATDGSGTLCDQLIARDPDRIRVIHQPNSGAGAARNSGILHAKGTYLLFVDGDDYLSDNLLCDLQKAIQKVPSELYLFGAQVERDGNTVSLLQEEIPTWMPTNAAKSPELFFGVMAPWSRAYHRSLFENSDIAFATNVWYEDIRIVTKILALAKSAVRLPDVYYHYIQRDGSAMRNSNCKRNVEILYAFDDILDWFHSHGYWEQYRQELTYLAITHVLIAASVRVIQIDRKHHLVGDFLQYMEKNFPDFRENPYLPRLDRNKRLIYKLLLKHRYRSIQLIFRIKSLLGS